MFAIWSAATSFAGAAMASQLPEGTAGEEFVWHGFHSAANAMFRHIVA
jgi:hypothetical protein